MGKQVFTILFYLLLLMLEIFYNKKLKNKKKLLQHATSNGPPHPHACSGTVTLELAALRAERMGGGPPRLTLLSNA